MPGGRRRAPRRSRPEEGRWGRPPLPAGPPSSTPARAQSRRRRAPAILARSDQSVGDQPHPERQVSLCLARSIENHVPLSRRSAEASITSPPSGYRPADNRACGRGNLATSAARPPPRHSTAPPILAARPRSGGEARSANDGAAAATDPARGRRPAACWSYWPNSCATTASRSRPRATARRRCGGSRRGWPDLILLDLMMPRVDGLALARQIKAQADLPIIVLSAIDTADSKASLLDEVAEDYVAKPYHYPELRARIQRVLRRLGDRIPRQSLVLGPNLTLDLHRRSATVAGTRSPAHADRIAAAPRSGGQPGRDRDDRHAAGPRLGRDRGRRAVVRLGLHAPASPEGRGRPGPARSPADRPRRRLPTRGEP